MVQSALTVRAVPHHNKLSSRQGRPVLKFLPHHWAGIGGGDARLMDPNQQASANYIIYGNGEIVVQVPEEFRAWTSGSFEADADAITVEVQNSSSATNGGDDDPNSWQISPEAQSSLVRLAADVAARYRWGAVSLANWAMHRMFYQTACPGGFMMANRPRFVNSAQALLIGRGSASAPAAPPVGKKTVWQLADEVMAGLHGQGVDRQNSLGSQFNAVQAEVNRRSGLGAIPTAKKSVGQLADEVIAGVHGQGDARAESLGARFPEVQAEVNRRLGAAKPKPSAPLSISQLADMTLAGKFGNGDARVRNLGKNFTAVQNEINRRMGATGVAPKSISQLADEVLAGKHGDGAVRQRSLGANYNAVQAEINRRFS